MSRPFPPKKPFLAVFLAVMFVASAADAASTNFYSLEDAWNQRKISKDSKEAALDSSFNRALVPALNNNPSIPTLPPVRKRLSEVRGNLVEIEYNQILLLDTNGGITKFFANEDGVVTMETVDSVQLRILGTAIGQTFLHVYDDTGRTTFELHVLAPTFVPSVELTRQMEASERNRPFTMGYNVNRAATYRGDKYSEMDRQSLDLTQSFSLNGDTPYGAASAYAVTEKVGGKNVLATAQVALTDASIKGINNFNVAAIDVQPNPRLIVLPSARVRGGFIEKWNEQETTRVSGFYGRELPGLLGTATPGLLGGERTRDSFLSGLYGERVLSDRARVKGGYFTGSGRSRNDDLNRWGTGVQGELDITPELKFIPEVDFDSEHFAQRYAGIYRRKGLQVRNEFRDVGRRFFTLVGSPIYQGEIGNLTELAYEPTDWLTMIGSNDIFRDRLIPNPDDPTRLNRHSDFETTIRLNDISSVTLGVNDIDDRGRSGPSTQRSYSAQYNRQVWLFNHPVSFFSRYQNRDVDIINNRISNYIQDQLITGLLTTLFWDISFSLQKEWNRVEEPFLSLVTYPHATVYSLSRSKQIDGTPFFLETSLRYRDEEETESTNSFMAGEDSTEVSAGFYYREYENMELFINGSVQFFRPENVNRSESRTEAQVITGMRYLYDTGIRWAAAGTVRGVVFKDLSGDGIRQPGEPGLPGVTVTSASGSAVTASDGSYEIKVSGRQAAVLMDASGLPSGYSPTSSAQQDVPIQHGKTAVVDFGAAPRSEIVGIVFNDLNGSGRYETTDKGIRRVKVLLDGGSPTRTNDLGVYVFPKVAPGDHTLSLDLSSLAEGYLPADVPSKTVTLFEGVRYEQPFAVRALRSATGRVFWDLNGNGRLDADEQPVVGAKVLAGSQESVSDTDGYYLFDALPSGSLKITIDPSTLPPGSTIAKEQTLEVPEGPAVFAERNLAVVES